MSVMFKCEECDAEYAFDEKHQCDATEAKLKSRIEVKRLATKWFGANEEWRRAFWRHAETSAELSRADCALKAVCQQLVATVNAENPRRLVKGYPADLLIEWHPECPLVIALDEDGEARL